MFLHYPPTNILQEESVFTQMAQEYGVEHVVYSHCHGSARFGDSIRGMKEWILNLAGNIARRENL